MAGGTIPRGFGLALGRSRSVTTTGWLRWSERNGGGGVARRTPTSIRNGEGGTFYFDTECRVARGEILSPMVTGPVCAASGAHSASWPAAFVHDSYAESGVMQKP